VQRHDLDILSLLAGLVFLVLGGVGLLRATGVLDSGTPWAVIGVVAVIGTAGVVVSATRMRS
jgi:hypothetical protein